MNSHVTKLGSGTALRRPRQQQQQQLRNNPFFFTLNIMISIIVMVTVAYFLAACKPFVNISTNSSYNSESLPPKTSTYSAVHLNAARSIENFVPKKKQKQFPRLHKKQRKAKRAHRQTRSLTHQTLHSPHMGIKHLKLE